MIAVVDDDIDINYKGDELSIFTKERMYKNYIDYDLKGGTYSGHLELV